jgi:hypothetical protein
VPDLAVANVAFVFGLPSVSVLLGNGDGSFQPAVNYAASFPGAVAIGDFNGDAVPDLAVANEGSDSVSVLLGHGDGTFQAARNFAVGVQPGSVALGDFNGDGLPDLAVVNRGECDDFDCVSSSLSVLLGNGDGTFQAAVPFAAHNSSFLAVGDFNGDGRPDLVVANNLSGDVSVLINNTPRTANLWRVVGVGDFNGDGHADVLWFNATTGTLAEWLLDGQGNVLAGVNLSLTCGAGCSPPWQVVGVGDFNGDGFADVLWFNANTGTLAEWLLDGQGNVRAGVNLSLTCDSECSSQWRVLGVGDFNGDGFADVLWFNAETGTLAEWLLDGQGNVRAGVNLSLTCGAGCSPQWRVLGVGDFNGDGHADVLWFNADTGTLAEWLLDGQGNVMAGVNLSLTCGAGCSAQ